ncbi:hypothetical protein ES703_04580 [subsurface metagenome]
MVGLNVRKSGDSSGGLHHLLLVDEHTVGSGKHRFQTRMQVGDLAFSVFAAEELIQINVGQWSGSVDCDNRDDVLDLGRTKFSQYLTHTPAFQLEDASGLGALQQLEGFFIIQWKIFGVDFLTVLVDELGAHLDHRECPQPQDVHLQKTD